MRVLFHTGFPKCGSTTLQHRLFAAHRRINYLSGNVPLGRSISVDERLRSLPARLWSTDEAEVSRAFEAWSALVAPRLVADRVNVFSEEALLVAGAEPAVVLARIARLARNAEVLLIVRPQHEIVRSLYDMYPVTDVDERSSGRAVPIEDYVSSVLEAGAPFSAERFMFARRVEEARAAVGADNVHVMSFHDVFRTGEGAARLARLLEIDGGAVRAAVSAPPVNDFTMHAVRRRMRRLLGPVRGSWFLPRPALVAINRGIGRLGAVSRTEMPQILVDRIGAHFAEDNARLAALVPAVGQPA